MSKKPAAKGRKRRVPEPEPAGDGVMARLVDHAFENPAMSGGLLVMALTATAIVSNAMFLQRGSHPEPLFMTRSAEAPLPHRAPATQHRQQAVQSAEYGPAAPPLPRLSPVHTASITDVYEPEPEATVTAQPMPQVAPVPPEALENEASPAVILLTAIQRELARLGLYSGAIDGLMGQRTAAAIAAFEAAANMPVTGQPSAELLRGIRDPRAPAMVQAAAQRTQASPAGPDKEAAELDRRERERARMIAEQEQSAAVSRQAANTRIVQSALNRIGYGPLPTDGSAAEDTADAIRRFELDNGMAITGKAGNALIERLIAIGAVKPG